MTRVAPLRNTFARLHCRATSPIQLHSRSLRLYPGPIAPPFKTSVSSLSRKRIEFPGPRNSQLRYSSASSWIGITLAGLLGGLLLYTFSPHDVEHSRTLTDLGHLASRHKMAPTVGPGRPETLTAAEEEKLREFWTATFKICGIPVNEEGQADADSSTKTDTKAKKKKGFLRRLAGSSNGAEEEAAGPDSNDKHGQLKDYNDALASMSPEAIRESIWNMVKVENPDAIMLRFLRARKWDVQKAIVMMISTMTWRARDMHVDDDIMKNGELVILDETDTDPARKKLASEMKLQLVTGKSFLHGLDKEGRPMCFIRVRLHRPGEQDIQSIERFTVLQIETARLMMEHPTDTACMVFDMTDFGLANMDYAPIKFIIKCFEANYPESLGVVLIHKAPWVFQGVWKVIKGWLDPVVASKVNFTNNKAELEQYVDSSRIITELSGDEDFKYHYVEPVPGENDAMKDTETRDRLLAERQKITSDYEKATVQWIRSSGAEREAAQATRVKLAKELKDGYWKLDPYIRARSNYDRWRVINPGGRIDFYPKAAPTSTTGNGVETADESSKAENGAKPAETAADDVD